MVRAVATGAMGGLVAVSSTAVPEAAALLPVAFAPFLIVARGARPLIWGLAGAAAGTAWFAPFLPGFAPASWFLATGAFSAFSTAMAGVFAGAGVLARRFALLHFQSLAVVWTVAAYVMDEWIYAWPVLGAGLGTLSPELLRPMGLVGAAGYDGLVLALSGAVAALCWQRSWRNLATLSVLCGVAGTAIVCAGASVRGPAIPVRLVQPVTRWIEYRMASETLPSRDAIEHRVDHLTRRALNLAQEPGLIVWPEGATGMADAHVPRRRRAIRRILGTSRSVLLAGTNAPADGRWYNALVAFSPNPGQAAFKARVVPLAEKHFAPGEPKVLETSLGRVGAAICFDALFGRHFRRLVRENADVLVVVSDDSLFGNSFVTSMHTAYARARTVEVGRALVFSSNTGPSFVTNPDGSVAGTIGFGERGFLNTEAPVAVDLTPAVAGMRHLSIVGILGLLVAVRRRSPPERSLQQRQRRPIAWPARDVVAGSANLLGCVAVSLLVERTLLWASWWPDPRDALRDTVARLRPPGPFEGIAAAFRQARHESCGAAALAFVLTRLGEKLTEEDLTDSCMPGSSASLGDMKRCANQMGFRATGYSGPWTAFLKEPTGTPTFRIIHLRPGHFVVVVDATDQQATYFEPATGTMVTTTRTLIEKSWSRKWLSIGYLGE